PDRRPYPPDPQGLPRIFRRRRRLRALSGAAVAPDWPFTNPSLPRRMRTSRDHGQEQQLPGNTIGRPGPEHRAACNALYAAYAACYKVAQTAEMRDRVWSWIHDEAEEVECFLAFDGSGTPV